MPHVADRSFLGVIPLQDHEAGVSVETRLAAAGGRVSRWVEETGSVAWAKSGGKGTLGDLHPYRHWGAATRAHGAWSPVYAVIGTEDFGSTREYAQFSYSGASGIPGTTLISAGGGGGGGEPASAGGAGVNPGAGKPGVGSGGLAPGGDVRGFPHKRPWAVQVPNHIAADFTYPYGNDPYRSKWHGLEPGPGGSYFGFFGGRQGPPNWGESKIGLPVYRLVAPSNGGTYFGFGAGPWVGLQPGPGGSFFGWGSGGFKGGNKLITWLTVKPGIKNKGGELYKKKGGDKVMAWFSWDHDRNSSEKVGSAIGASPYSDTFVANPIRHDGYAPDTSFRSVAHAWPDFMPTMPANAMGLGLAGTEESAQANLFMPTDPRLCAPNVAGWPECGSWVCDMRDNGTLDTDGNPIIGGRAARLQSVFRVWRPPEEISPANGIALQFTASGIDDLAGYGAIYGLYRPMQQVTGVAPVTTPSSGRANAGTVWGLDKHAQANTSFVNAVSVMSDVAMGRCRRGPVARASSSTRCARASLVSSIFIPPYTPGVGASGAIFGTIGALILTVRRSPLWGRKEWSSALARQLAICAGINILIGFTRGRGRGRGIGGRRTVTAGGQGEGAGSVHEGDPDGHLVDSFARRGAHDSSPGHCMV